MLLYPSSVIEIEQLHGFQNIVAQFHAVQNPHIAQSFAGGIGSYTVRPAQRDLFRTVQIVARHLGIHRKKQLVHAVKVLQAAAIGCEFSIKAVGARAGLILRQISRIAA